jgi:hypothetical protein
MITMATTINNKPNVTNTLLVLDISSQHDVIGCQILYTYRDFRFEIMSNPTRCGRLGSWNESWPYYAQTTQTKERHQERMVFQNW